VRPRAFSCVAVSRLTLSLSKHSKNLERAKPSRDFYEVLDALQALTDLKMSEAADPKSPQAITRRLAAVVWGYTFMHYFWLKERRNKS